MIGATMRAVRQPLEEAEDAALQFLAALGAEDDSATAELLTPEAYAGIVAVIGGAPLAKSLRGYLNLTREQCGQTQLYQVGEVTEGIHYRALYTLKDPWAKVTQSVEPTRLDLILTDRGWGVDPRRPDPSDPTRRRAA
jgi:hypothetical protein